MSYLNNFHYRITGDKNKPKLVFLHGLMGFANNWRSIAKHFERDFEILCLDQRGHGRSFHPESGYSPEDYAEDLRKIIDELGWAKIHLVGHSMGARNSHCFSHNNSHRLSSLVLEDLGPEADPQALLRNQELIDRVGAPFENKNHARAHIEREFKDEMTLGEYFYANLTQKEGEDGGYVDWRFSLKGIIESVEAGRNTSRWNEIESIQCPCLLIRGELSEDLSRETYEKMLKSNTKLRGVEIEGARHWVHFDRQKEFISVLKEFYVEQSLMSF
ncbi:MAG: alpha/beta fold hydrolase [Bdellovibrionales bacterium]